MENYQLKLLRRIVITTILLWSASFYSAARAWENHNKRDVTVMTQNMDAGTDLSYLFTVPDLLQAASLTYGEVIKSNIPMRSAQLAKIIARKHPDLISLQEVTLWQTVSSDQKRTVLYDQLELLLKALNKQYKVVVSQDLTQNQLPVNPALIGRPNDSARALSLTDRNVVLVRTDIKPSELRLSHIQKHEYSTFLTLPLGKSKRGWLSVDARVHGKSVRFVNTHLETVLPFNLNGTKAIQVAQANELIKSMMSTNLPVILAGDFNADAEFANVGPDQTETPYKLMDAGYVDSWHELHPDKQGFTWPLYFKDPLRPNPSGPFERIDLIYTRDLEIMDVHRVTAFNGNNFPSDHAGVVATLLIDKPHDWNWH